MDTNELRKAATAVYLATDKSVADDLSAKLAYAAETIDELRSRIKLILVKKTAEELEEIEKNYPCCNSDKFMDVFVPVDELNSNEYDNLKELIGIDKARELNLNSIVLFYMD